uniref:C2H2-type domain-containing protein n=1 Tax=Pelodiscus sinensis TaxID=13735 RepID=K7FHE1_PELSI
RARGREHHRAGAGCGELCPRLGAGKRPFVCPECGKSFTQKPNLVKHHRTHTGERPFSCAQCGKSFNQKTNLVTHYRTHTGERPYACPQCGKRFTQKTNLVTHQSTHTDVRPYPCGACHKCFKDKVSLKAHQRTHGLGQARPCGNAEPIPLQGSPTLPPQPAGAEHLEPCLGPGGAAPTAPGAERPFICNQCGSSFGFWPALVAHQSSHAGWQPYPPPERGK